MLKKYEGVKKSGGKIVQNRQKLVKADRCGLFLRICKTAQDNYEFIVNNADGICLRLVV